MSILVDFAIQLLISLLVSIIAYAIMPQVKVTRPRELTDLNIPTASGGRPIPVVFGDITVKSPNILWYGEKRSEVVTV